MNELVFLEPNKLDEVPFTTSKVVAENGKVEHETVQRLIRNYTSDLEELGGYEHIKVVREESYKLLDERAVEKLLK